MPKYIVLRLHPIEPTTGAEFEDYIKDLNITVNDLALAPLVNPPPDQKGKVVTRLLGTAEFKARVSDPTPDFLGNWRYDQDTTIVQHFYTDINNMGVLINKHLFSVATAVIAIPGTETGAATPRVEYESSDLQLEIQRNGKIISKRKLDFNVRESKSYEPKAMPAQFSTLEDDQNEIVISLYIALPAPKNIDEDTAILELPEDGRPPNFSDLYEAVKTVLKKEPEVADNDADIQARLRELTPVEARHIAYEIMHHSDIYPPADPKIPMEWIFTTSHPFPISADSDKGKQARDLFEAESIRYKATRAAQAERVSTYVYSLAMAFVAQQKSEDATKVGFTFPIHPSSSDLTKVQKAKVVLKN